MKKSSSGCCCKGEEKDGMAIMQNILCCIAEKRVEGFQSTQASAKNDQFCDRL